MDQSHDLRIFVEPQQGASYDQQLAMAQAAEVGGFSAFFRSDHLLVMGDGSGQPGPTDAWTTIAALGRETTSIRLGTLVTSGTFRLPGLLAITVAQADAMSGGRVELGLGAGWYAEEHSAYAVPFPSVSERFARLEEQFAIITGLWNTPVGEKFSFAGQHYVLADSPALPKPVQTPHPPLIVGGTGATRTPRLAARYAAEYNVPFHGVPDTAAAFGRVREACSALERDPDELVYSHAIIVCCGRTDAELAARAARIGRDLDELRINGAAGTPEEVAATLRTYAGVGASRSYLQVLDMDDLDHVALIADAVAPLLH